MVQPTPKSHTNSNSYFINFFVVILSKIRVNIHNKFRENSKRLNLHSYAKTTHMRKTVRVLIFNLKY